MREEAITDMLIDSVLPCVFISIIPTEVET